MRKAQIETMGLVIIVALLAFILVFVLQVMNKPQDNMIFQSYMQLNADNLRSTILKTNACPGVNVREEILSCNDFSVTECSNLNCNDLKINVQKIIENSLNVTKNYKFTAGNIVIEKNFNLCKSTNSIYTAVKEPIPNSNVEISLSIC